jgi:hypothetical protein
VSPASSQRRVLIRRPADDDMPLERGLEFARATIKVDDAHIIEPQWYDGSLSGDPCSRSGIKYPEMNDFLWARQLEQYQAEENHYRSLYRYRYTSSFSPCGRAELLFGWNRSVELLIRRHLAPRGNSVRCTARQRDDDAGKFTRLPFADHEDKEATEREDVRRH